MSLFRRQKRFMSTFRSSYFLFSFRSFVHIHLQCPDFSPNLHEIFFYLHEIFQKLHDFRPKLAALEFLVNF